MDLAVFKNDGPRQGPRPHHVARRRISVVLLRYLLSTTADADDKLEFLAHRVSDAERHAGRAGEPLRCLGDPPECALGFAGRRRDGAQNVGRGRLTLECFAQLGQKPRVLNSDHRLVGEILHLRKLHLGEWPHSIAHQHNRADGFAFAHERCRDHATRLLGHTRRGKASAHFGRR